MSSFRAFDSDTLIKSSGQLIDIDKWDKPALNNELEQIEAQFGRDNITDIVLHLADSVATMRFCVFKDWTQAYTQALLVAQCYLSKISQQAEFQRDGLELDINLRPIDIHLKRVCGMAK